MLCVGTYIMKKFLYSDRSSQLWLPWLSSTLPSWRHLSANCWNTTVRLRNFEKILAVQNFCSKGRKELCGRRPPKDHNAAAGRQIDHGKIEIITFINGSLWLDQGRITKWHHSAGRQALAYRHRHSSFPFHRPHCRNSCQGCWLIQLHPFFLSS